MAVSRKGKTVGRPRGQTTIRSREIADRLAAIENALTPLEVMIEGMRALWRASQTATTRAEQYERRREAISAAKDAAPYMHPRLSSITASIRKVNNIKDLRDDELAALMWRAGSRTPWWRGVSVSNSAVAKTFTLEKETAKTATSEVQGSARAEGCSGRAAPIPDRRRPYGTSLRAMRIYRRR